MSRIMSQHIFGAALLWVGVIMVTPSAFAQTQEKPVTQDQQLGQQKWDQNAEKTFGLERGIGRQLMTQEEWQEHHQRMRQMNGQDCEQYRNEWQAKMQARAKEKGITLPGSPGPNRWSQGHCPGMGRGRGMGGRRG